MIDNSDNTQSTIGIYSIFIDTYVLFYKNFIRNMELNFLPQYKKYYYIVTDKTDITVYNDRTYILNVDKIGWPYETLYRYKYYLLFDKDHRNKSTYTYFLNSNASCVDIINDNILPDLNHMNNVHLKIIHYLQHSFLIIMINIFIMEEDFLVQ